MPRVPRDPTPFFSVAETPYAPALAFHTQLTRSLHVPADFRALPSTDLAAAVEYAANKRAGGVIVGKHLERHAIPLAQEVSESASQAAAANALVAIPGGFRAVNTVVDAASAALVRARVRCSDVVVLHGAGAPASAVCAALRLRGVQRVIITGRNEHAGRLLAALHGFTWSQAVPRGATVLINATPLGDMGPLSTLMSLPAEAVESARAVIDLALGPHATPVVRLARAAGVRAVSGMSVVADQWTAISRAFTGVRARSWQVDKALREAYAPSVRRRQPSAPARSSAAASEYSSR